MLEIKIFCLEIDYLSLRLPLFIEIESVNLHWAQFIFKKQ